MNYPRSPYSASHLLLDQLTVEGTRFIFGSLASGESPVIATALETRADINFLAGLHEQIAGSMAMGYAQASGRAGVVSLPAATGLINALSSMYNARHARVPMVVLADQQDTQILNDSPPLSGDLCELARPVSKWTCQLNNAEEIPRVIRRAFHEALSAPKGPVFVSMPVNILLRGATSAPIRPPQASPLGAADNNFLRKAAKAIVDAKRPCIIAGNEVSLFRARKEVVTLAEVVGCPVFSEPMPTGVNFPNRHPLYGGVIPMDPRRASGRLRAFDLILVLGMQTRMPSVAVTEALISESAQVIQVNIESALAGRSLPCAMSANADIAETMSRLRAELQLIVNSAWVNEAKQRGRDTVQMIAALRQDAESRLTYPNMDSGIPLTWLLRLLDNIRPKTSVIVNDLIAPLIDPLDVLNLESSSAYFASNGGVTGHGMAAALGVQWASPESTVICITSDTSTLYYPQALWTASHYGLNVKFVIVNTQGRNTFNAKLTPDSPPESRLTLENPTISLPDLARSMRVQGITVSGMSGLEGALKLMLQTPGPFVLDAHVTEE